MTQAHHFYASSAATWATTTDQRSLKELIRLMDSEGLTYNLFFVPVSWDADYEIRQYQPQVKGAVFIDNFEPKTKKLKVAA